jgi:Ca-activated chloride channel family protein
MTDILGIHWASIDNIVYAPIFLLFAYLAIKNYLRIKKSARLLVHPHHRKELFKHFSLLKEFLKATLLCGALMVLFLAFLQPQWGKRDEQVIQEGRDLLILLDVSRSMMAQDLKPNRLEFAKLKVRTLLSKLTFERVGLIAFAGSAFVQCPLTIDHPTFLMFLDHLDAETISSGTTAIDTALTKAMHVFESAQGRKNKNVILLTDGEDFSLNLDTVKQKAAEQQVKLFALGIGTPQGAPIPLFDAHGNQAGHITDAKGAVVLSTLNEKLLQSMCTTLNGSYFTTTYEDSDLDHLVSIIKKMEKEKLTEKKLSLFEDHYPWFLGLAWALLIIEWLL